MSVHAYSRCWMHIVWSTYQRQPVISKETAVQISNFLYDYSKSKSVFMKINYVNKDHVHVLIDLPRHLSLEETVKLLKGSSSYWINQKSLMVGKFNWSRGYAGFSVAQSTLKKTIEYIASQEEHHR